MQMQMNLTVFGVNKITVDRDVYCSVFAGQPATDPTQTRGYEVMKLSAEPEVFDQLADLKSGDEVEFISVLKRAAGGKSQPFLVGVVPKKAPQGSTPKPDSK
ncbi:MAG: hypothetical protein ABJQ78_00405 [Alloalcanivorax sp.]